MLKNSVVLIEIKLVSLISMLIPYIIMFYLERRWIEQRLFIM